MGREEDKRILFDKPIPTVYEQWNAIQTNVHIYNLLSYFLVIFFYFIYYILFIINKIFLNQNNNNKFNFLKIFIFF